MHSTIRQLEAVEVHVDLVSDHPYGKVSGGYLQVASSLATAKILYKERPTLAFLDAPGDYTSLPVTLDLSWTKDEISDALQSTSTCGVIYILEVMEQMDAKEAYKRA